MTRILQSNYALAVAINSLTVFSSNASPPNTIPSPRNLLVTIWCLGCFGSPAIELALPLTDHVDCVIRIDFEAAGGRVQPCLRFGERADEIMNAQHDLANAVVPAQAVVVDQPAKADGEFRRRIRVPHL